MAYLAESKNYENENIQVVNGSSEGEPAPYNGEVEYSINTKKAQKLGFAFSNIHDWINDLLDYYICEARSM